MEPVCYVLVESDDEFRMLLDWCAISVLDASDDPTHEPGDVGRQLNAAEVLEKLSKFAADLLHLGARHMKQVVAWALVGRLSSCTWSKGHKDDKYHGMN